MTRHKAVDGKSVTKTSPPAVKGARKAGPIPAGAGIAAQSASSPELKAKLVRDSFTIPENEYLVLESLKARAAHLRRPTKKGELLRAGIAALHGMSDRAFLLALAKVPSLKTGRPKEVKAVA